MKQIPVSYKNKDELRKLVNKCKENGYELYHGLSNIKDDDHIVAICIDIKNKKVFQLNGMCMAMWSGGVNRPLYADEIFENFDEIVLKQNDKLCIELLEKARKDETRPIGALFSMKGTKNDK